MIIPVVILSLILLLLIKNHLENFTVNPNSFFDTPNAIEKMRVLRECQNVVNKDACILSKKPFTPHFPPDRTPYQRHVNFNLYQDVRHLLPQRR